MNNNQEEDDEAIVGTTIAEVCVILILLFFLALAFGNQKSGDTLTSTNPETIPFPQDLLTRLEDFSCNFELQNGNRTLVLLWDSNPQNAVDELLKLEFKKSEIRRTMFRQGQANLTLFGRECVNIVCEQLMEIVLEKDSELFVDIIGHTSSEWGSKYEFCQFDENTRKQGCIPCYDKFYCNLALSTARASNVMLQCNLVGPNNTHDISTIEKRQAIFRKHFSVAGRSFAELVIEQGEENKQKSRRVEFTTRTR